MFCGRGRCCHVFGLLMRPHMPLAIVPSAKTGPDQKHALEAHWRRWVFRLRGFDRFSHYMLSALPKLCRAASLRWFD